MLAQKTARKNILILFKRETVSTTPRDYSKDSPAIALLKHKQFHFCKKLFG
jgi:hypothetical protein